MDAVDIIIMAAAGIGLVAFVVLAVIILRQGRSIKELEDRIGPPVPPAAAPSLERVRALTAGAAVAADPAPQPAQRPPAGEPAQPARKPTAREQARANSEGAAAAAGAAAAGAGGGSAEAPADSAGAAPARGAPAREPAASRTARADTAADESSGRGFLMATAVLLAIAIIGVGSWWFFLRGDGSSTPTSASTGTQTTATAADTGEIPEEIPPVANKAAYTVAVLNASNVTGAAANKVAPRVQADGYTLGVVDNATKQNVTQSEVQYVPGRKEVAWNLAKDLGITRAVAVDSLSQGRIGTADVVVVVGKDLAK